MKIVICLFLIVVSWSSSFAQIKITEELRNKLDGKTKFHDIKNTVITHYEKELKKLTLRDSVQRKSIMRQLKMWNREFWINEYYTDENDKVKPQSKVILDALANRERDEPKAKSRNQPEGWVFNGPYDCDNGIGRISRLAFHPSNSNIIFAGSRFGGLFKSEDGGNTWQAISEYNSSLGVAGIAIHPTNPSIIYVLSGDGDSQGGSFAGGYNVNLGELLSACNGVYKSIDGGASWTKLQNFPGIANSDVYSGHKLILQPSNPNILIVVTSKGIFKTSNGGITWTNISPKNNINYWDIKFKHGSSNTIYATSTELLNPPCPNNNCYSSKFYKSTDLGANWDTISVSGITGASRISIGVTPANTSKVVLLCGTVLTDTTFTGVFISNDSGQTFGAPIQTPNLFSNQIGNAVYNDQSDSDNTIVISINNENEFYVGGLCVWKSSDNGTSWTQISAYWSSDTPYMHPDIRELSINPLNNKLYSGNDGGVYELYNGEWLSKFKGLSTSQFYHFEEENDEDDTWGGTQDNGILERENGNTFYEYDGGDGYDVMTDHPSRSTDGNSENVFWTVNASIYTDCGTGDICNISVPSNANFFGNLAMHPQDNDILYVGYQSNVFKSLNAGDDWTPIQNIPGNWSICAGKNHSSRIYTSGERGNSLLGIWRTDDGSAWTQINSNLLSIKYDSTKITDIEINRDNDDIVYFTCAGTVDSSKVYMSINAGATWTNISYNLPNIPVFCILRDSFDGLYIGTSIGVYYKRASQEHWEPFYNGLPAVPITQLVFEEEGSIFVHCSTFGRGLWRTLKYQNDCQTNLTLSGNPQGTNYWEVSNDINSTQNIKGPGTKIIYSAGNKITLTNGMKVEAGAKFHGVSQPCGSEIENP